MSLEESMTELEEFEFLMALKLSDEISAEQENRLQELTMNPELNQKYRRYIQTRQFVARGVRTWSLAGHTASKREHPSVSPGQNQIDWLSANKAVAFVGIAAAAIIGVSILFYAQKKPPETFRWADKRGTCESQKNKPTAFRTGQGVCDLKQDTIAVRLLPESELDSALSEAELRFEFHGRLSVDAGKQNRALIFSSGENSVRILGTRLVLTSENGIFRAEMIQGSAEVRTRTKTEVVSTGQAIEVGKADLRQFQLTEDRLWLLRRWSSGLKGNPDPALTWQLVQLKEPGIFYVLRLKDGRSFTGPVKQTATHYFVMTADGDFEIPNDQVESIDVFP